jgi:monoamine oxidase
LAGLHAGLLLDEKGLNTVVVEAQDRTGGRIHSMRQLGSNAEAGGTFIGAGYKRIFAVAKRFGINLIDVTPLLEFFREQDLSLGDEIIRQSEWESHPANPFPEQDRAIMPWNYHRVLTMRENPLPAPSAWLEPEFSRYDISMHEWMRSIGLDEEVIKLGYNLNTSFGENAHDVSALLLFFRAAFSKAQRKDAPKDSIGFTVENGVQRIPDAMAAGLQTEVLFNHAVTAIEQSGKQLTVTFKNGQSLTADHVICTLPFGVLKQVHISPALNEVQARAIREVPSQPVSQFYFSTKSEFWREDGYAPSLFTDGLPGMVAAVRDGTDPTRITHLTAWLMGKHAAALHGLSEHDAAQQIISDIERRRPAASGQLECIGSQMWGSDPYALGAWAYFRPGQIKEYARAMGTPHGRLHFCGEHLALTTRGMEGALESAEAAVSAISGDS